MVYIRLEVVPGLLGPAAWHVAGNVRDGMLCLLGFLVKLRVTLQVLLCMLFDRLPEGQQL